MPIGSCRAKTGVLAGGPSPVTGPGTEAGYPLAPFEQSNELLPHGDGDAFVSMPLSHCVDVLRHERESLPPSRYATVSQIETLKVYHTIGMPSDWYSAPHQAVTKRAICCGAANSDDEVIAVFDIHLLDAGPETRHAPSDPKPNTTI